jgi:manganese/zinc/iron transport system permease protein
LARFRLRVAREHLLRGIYELTEAAAETRPGVALDRLLAARAWRPWQVRWLLRLTAVRGETVRTGAGDWRLTARGLDRAVAVVNAHRLWEMFLVERVAVAPDHVHRDADEIEHLLAPELLVRLAGKNRTDGPPPSVHPLETTERA